MPKPVTEEDAREDSRDVSRALRVQAFLASDFWREYLAPYLQGVEEDCKAGALVQKPYSGLTVEGMALGVMFNSGRVAQITDLREEMAIWQEKGKQAQLRIDRREEKK